MRRVVRLSPERLVGFFLLLGLLAPAVSRAEIIDEEEVNRFTLGLSVGYAGNAMGRFNENLDVVNYFLTNQGIPLREADALNGSASARGEFRYRMSERFSIGMGIANTESKSQFGVTLGAVDFYARSTLYMPAVYYHFPFVQNSEAFTNVADRMSIYVGAGPVFFSNARTHVRIYDASNEPTFNVDGDLGEIDGEADAEGTGIGFQGLLGASYQLTRTFSFAAEAGYRYGKVTDLELTYVEGYVRDDTEDDPNRREPGDGAMTDFFDREKRAEGLPESDIEGNHIPYYSDYSGPLELDFSGITLQLALRIHLF